ncbi:MAG: prolyl oligopeptidase family serine peptidase [Planctomycetota bacterium]|nr:prolyl oligopeptidase family serine peptidase [Planctomycetota bacterium]
MTTSRYQRPPKEITDVLDVGPTPGIALSPARDFLLLIERSNYPPIEDLAAPMLKLAGLRINPLTNGPHLAPRSTGLILQSIAAGEQRRIAVTEHANIGFRGWSPDGQQLAFTVTTSDSIQLWVASVRNAAAHKIDGLAINGAYGIPIQWLPDSSGLLVQAIPNDRGHPPEQPKAPPGPIIEESAGRSGPVRTYQDLLQNSHDKDLLEYYCRSQMVVVDPASMLAKPIGPKSLFASDEVSPDGEHILMIRIERPYSYLLPVSRFPKTIEVWSRQGDPEFTVASLPLQDSIPIEGVPTGPRSVTWQPNLPATLSWLEALDCGDPQKSVLHRDRVLSQAAPFDSVPVELVRTEHRCLGIQWGEKDGLAFVRDYDRDRRWTRTLRINTERPEVVPGLMWERSIHDRYGDPGTPMHRLLPNGQSVMWQHHDSLFLQSNGATPVGDRPFLDRFDLATGASKRLFACDDQSYESVVALLADDGTQFLTQHESPIDPPNVFLYGEMQARRALTNFPDPMPQLRSIHKELVTYERSDGVPLSFMLYLPPGYRAGTPLPTVVWAYPREFNDSSTAGQVSGSTNRFTSIGGISHLFLLTQGYAILDEATMPVVGTPDVANDSFVEQVVASAQAAIDKAVEMGITDRTRVGVGGHSYGAFMTANLLAHSDLFKTGVARSGAYNRTLTPFGFQNERRTFWEAPQIYMSMSPFAAADRIKAPILLIHGEADNNPGTFPIQSERLYHAVRGNGGTVRYVILPHESHGYIARESVEHTLWEMVTWFDRYVKTVTDAPSGYNCN